MMPTRIPIAFLKETHRLQRKFILVEKENENKYHPVGWKNLTQPKIAGGLGLEKLDVINLACVSKLG